MSDRFQLGPVGPSNILHDPQWHIWGGGVVRADDGLYYMLVARWPREKGFAAWVTHSEIACATSTSPQGPYTMQGTVIGRRDGRWWDADNCHNPMPIRVNDRFYCYYTGNYGSGEWWDHRNHQRVGYAVADHPTGPWKRADVPLISTTPGAWDHLMTACPVVTRGGDERFYMVYKGVSKGSPPFGGQVRMGLAIADRPEGPFVKQTGNFFDAPGVKFPSDDNYIWFKDGAFHAIVKDYGGNFQNKHREALVRFVSTDCLHWEVDGANPVLTDFTYLRDDGQRVGPVQRLDQPQIIFDDTGTPLVLLLAVKEHPDDVNDDTAYNIHVPLTRGM